MMTPGRTMAAAVPQRRDSWCQSAPRSTEGCCEGGGATVKGAMALASGAINVTSGGAGKRELAINSLSFPLSTAGVVSGDVLHA